MLHEIACSFITITEELEYIPTLQILVNQINCAAHKRIINVILKLIIRSFKG